MATLTEAILELYPNLQFTLKGEPTTEDEFNSKFKKYVSTGENGIGVFTSDPTEFDVSWTDIQNKLTELNAAEPMEELRMVRNAKLAETDWVVIKEREEGGSVSNFADWKTYRQALRDITNSATSLDDVTWPEKPE